MDLFGPVRLPVPLAPLEEELFSSWFMRVAFANGLTVNSLARFLTGRGRQLFSGDPDRGVWLDPGYVLAELTGVSKEHVNRLYLRSYTDKLWPPLPDKGVWRNVLHVTDKAHARKYFGLQYCPECLANDATPYFRKHWRLSFYVICPTHRCFLRDDCYFCGAPVIPHRVGVGLVFQGLHWSIAKCHACTLDLCLAAGLQRQDPDEELVRFQAMLASALEDGWTNVNGSPVHGILFFEGFRIMQSLLDDPKRSGELQERLGMVVEKNEIRNSRYGGIETTRISRRIQSLESARRFLKDWPSVLIANADCLELSLSTFGKFSMSPQIPFWLDKHLREYVDRTMYVPSDQELANAAAYLFAQKMPTVKELCALLNMRTRSNSRVAKMWRERRQDMAIDLGDE
jgi:hypothetical protein